MEMRSILVVGDEYREFAKNEGVVTISQMLRELRDDPGRLAGAALFAGQGIDRRARDELESLALESGCTISPTSGPVPLAITHKATADYVLIGAPRCVGPGLYKTELEIGSGTDRLADHVTGQHIGGMLLVEAARQFGIAAIETEYAANGEMSYGFAWNSLSVRFLSYAFPVPTELTVQLTRNENQTRRNQHSIALAFRIVQCGQVVAEVSIETTLLEKAVLSKLESRRGAQIAEKQLGGISERAPDAAQVATA